ncbi:MAG: D-alanine--D-alanine ligase [Acidobacteriota bacterium]|nr:D-alanine--D-alanine ligase [Acidobacteriota bacterium]
MSIARRGTPGRVGRVGLLFGGPSNEHEVSLVSARGVAAALRQTSLEWFPLAVTAEGCWLSPQRSMEILESDDRQATSAADDSRLVFAPGSEGDPVRLIDDRGAQSVIELDVVFPLIHGWGGEDGRLQGMLDWCGIRCVGSGLLGSAVGMDKAIARRLFESAGLDVGPWVELRADEIDAEAIRRVTSRLPAPWFVKPACGGSSIGIRKVEHASELDDALRYAASFDDKILVELGLTAREIECAVLGNETPRCADAIGEIHASAAFYDYEAKYESGDSRLDIPADLPVEVASRLRDAAIRAYRVLGLTGYARVDFLVEPDFGHLWVNEVNTLPGFTPISMFPKLWEASGLAYPALIEELVRLAR